MGTLIHVDSKAEAFAAVGHGRSHGFGYGFGYGYGYGSGSGSVDGSDSGSGSGVGSGYDSGSGRGSGSGAASASGHSYGYGYGYDSGSVFGSVFGELCALGAFCGSKVYDIDGVPTLIDVVFGRYAKGRVLMDDMTTRVCYIAKEESTFAHGDTLHAAQRALMDKLFDDMPLGERINAFLAEHNLKDAYPNRDLFDWHHKLTGSCLAGRNAWVKNHGIDMDGSTTVMEFIALCENNYGRDAIRELKRRAMETAV